MLCARWQEQTADVTNFKPLLQLIPGVDPDCAKSGTSQRLMDKLSSFFWSLVGATLHYTLTNLSDYLTPMR